MSDRKICVCGRERGKEPVIITITTCRHKHPSKNDCSSSVCILNKPTSGICDSAEKPENNKKESLRAESNDNSQKKKKENMYITEYQTESICEPNNNRDSTSIPNQTDNNNTTVDNSVVSEEADKKEGTEKDEDTPTVVPDKIAGDIQAEETTEPIKIDEPPRSNTASSEYVIAASSELPDTTVEESSEIANTEANAIDENESNADDSTQAPENTVEQSEPAETEITNENAAEEATDESTDDSKNPTVMFVREIAINTMSFLDNLFWTRSTANKSKLNLSEDRDPENCSTEVFIFEKHSKFCRHYTDGPINQNLFFDGDRLCETLAKISFPAFCDDFKDGISKGSKLAAVYSRLKTSFITQEETDFYKRTFKTSNSFTKNKHVLEKLQNKNPEPLKFKLQKYITMGDDIYQKRFSNTDVKELYCRKSTNEQSIQMGEPHLNATNSTRSSKWYDIFLICLGLKESEDLCEEASNIELPGESSFIITRYLKI